MKRCVISQPRFFPGFHYLHRLLVADVFIVLDTVQYNPRHEENRAKLKAPDGTRWLTVPMRKVSRDQLIMDTEVGDQPWQDKALNTLQHLYAKSPFFAELKDEVASVITADHRSLVDLDLHSWQPALDRLKPDVEILLASDLDAEGAGSELLLNLCRQVGADVYLSGGFGRDYLDHAIFEAAGVGLEFHEYEYPTYPQNHGDFIGYLSYLDALFNVPVTRELVEQGADGP